MGRSPCCDKLGLKKGPWTPEEDQKLLAFIEENGHGNWRALPSKAGLQRCGKSCRLRWTNYLRPDIKRGKFSLQEEQTIIQLHALLGNRWSAIATHLPKRTDNEIKNYWNTHLKKRLAKMGIDPVTHKPKNDTVLSVTEGGPHSKNAANLSHMAQWESARLEAEARLVRQSKLRSSSTHITNNYNSSSSFLTQEVHVNEHHQIVTSVSVGPLSSSSSSSGNHYLCMSSGSGGAGTGAGAGGDGSDDVILKGWNSGGGWPSTTSSASANNDGFIGVGVGSTGLGDGGGGSGGGGVGVESPTSTLSFSENNAPAVVPSMETTGVIEFMGHHHHDQDDDHHHEDMMIKREGDHHHHEWMSSLSFIPTSSRFHDDNDNEEGRNHDESFMEGFTELLLSNNNNNNTKNDMPCEKGQQEEDNCTISQGTINTTTANSSKGSDYYEDNKTYWNSILNLVNSSPHSPMF